MECVYVGKGQIRWLSELGAGEGTVAVSEPWDPVFLIFTPLPSLPECFMVTSQVPLWKTAKPSHRKYRGNFPYVQKHSI